MPEPISSVATNVCEYDPSSDVCSVENSEPSSSSASGVRPPVPTPADTPRAVQALVDGYQSSPATLPPAANTAAPGCGKETAGLIVAGANWVRSTAMVAVTAPTLVGELIAVAGFIGSSVALGASAAQYLDCKDAPEPQSKARVK